MGKKKEKILKTKYEYLPADKELVVNDNDPDLLPIHIPLPEPPPLHKIDGYGLPPEEQKYTRPKVPPKLIKVQKECESLEQMWDMLESNVIEYADEIEWIRKQWYFRLNGYWFYNNGKPTYITGAHYFYLGFYKIDVGLPDYRDRSRKYFLVLDWAENYHYDFQEKKFDIKGDRLANNPGDELEDSGNRTILGIMYPKMRRAGATHESLCWMYERLSRSLQKLSGIQSIDEKHARSAYTKLVSSWRKIPFFFLPMFDGSTAPQKSMRFRKRGTKDVGKEVGLESEITFATSSSCYHYDGEKLFVYFFDEAGKLVNESLYMGWSIIKHTLAQGSGTVVSGFAVLVSTVGEFDKAGGEDFYYLLKDSNYYERTASGQTKSGLVTVFIPGYEGLEGYIDAHGNSVIDTPTPEQRKFTRKKIGAKEHLLNEREHYLRQGTPEAIEKYREQCRLFPMSLRECFINSGSGIGFNEIILDKRISELRFNDKATVRGNFEWLNGRKDGTVVWREDPVNGKWVVSKLLKDGQSNKKFFRDGMWWPYDRNAFMHCSDPFNFDEVEGKRMSKGAIIGIKRRDKTLDPDTKDISTWETPDVWYTYSFREKETDFFAEDCLLATIYYGGLHAPEVNNELVRKHFKKRGYGGYLYYFHDDKGGYRTTAGYSLRTNQDKLLGLAADYVERHGHRCNHIELLKQCKDLKGKKDITNKDLVAAFGGCCYAIDDDYQADETNYHISYDITNFIKKRRF